MANARTPHAGSAGRVSGTNAMMAPQGSRSRTAAPGAARTARRIPSPAGSMSVPVGAKLVVSIHAVRPSGGWNRSATRAAKTVTTESAPARPTSRKEAIVSSGSGTHAIQAPLGSTGTGVPFTLRPAGPAPPRTVPNRNEESCA